MVNQQRDDQEELADPDAELDLDEWLAEHDGFVAVSSPTARQAIMELEAERREAVERAEAAEQRAESETRTRQQLQQQVSARPTSGLVIDGQELGPWVTAGTYLLAAGVGFGVGVGAE